MNLKLLSVCVVLLLVCTQISGYKILVIFNMAAKSHYNLGSAYAKGLAEAGHDVTIISPFGEQYKPKNGTYREIVLTGEFEEQQKRMSGMDMFGLGDMNPAVMMSAMMAMSKSQIEDFFNHKNVQDLLNSDEKFDVVVIEQFMNDAIKALAYRFNSHIISFSTVGANAWVNGLVCNPLPLSYVPNVALGFPPDMTFWERFQNVMLTLFFDFFHYVLYLPLQESVKRKYVPEAPYVQDLMHNTSLVLLNSHESYLMPVPLVPNMINIGGFHLRPPKKLPKDLQEFLDNSPEGVIYFSMGSNLKSSNLPVEKRDAFLKTFSKLKQKVLWKWEDDNLPGQPPNVKLSKWFPQQDILAHPNVKVFMTHGGLLSTTETVYSGVPILAIPVFGDQKMNARLAEIGGYGLTVKLADISEETLTNTLNELLTNPKYYDIAQTKSKIMKDRLNQPINAAVYWTEYVVRHNGAKHLRVAGVNLPLYKYYLLDIIAVVIIGLVINLYITKKVFCLIKNKLKSKKKVKQN